MHLAAGAKMVPFAGYHMPLQYRGIIAEHQHTRCRAGLFDVSHMGQISVVGASAAQQLERLLPVDIAALDINQQCYALLTCSDGGIADDLIVTRLGAERFLLVVNAACKAQDLAYLQRQLSGCEVVAQDDCALLALQGPEAEAVLVEVFPLVAALSFMRGTAARFDSVECYISRSGYSGEDGFELSLPNNVAVAVAERLLRCDSVEWAGLGARDSLRLEAGLCLYGQDLGRSTTPVEAGLSWSVSRIRRAGEEKAGGFVGAEKILSQLADGSERKRVGFFVEGRAPVREGVKVLNLDGEAVGEISSGGYSPTLERPIAMGYIDSALAAPGERLQALVRGRLRPISVAKMPFVAHKYIRGRDKG